MHVTLIDYDNFGYRNPQNLTWPDSSVFWGTKHLAKLFYYVADPSYEFDIRLKTAVGKYNGGPGAHEFNGTFDLQSVNQYIDFVMSYTDDYQPRND